MTLCIKMNKTQHLSGATLQGRKESKLQKDKKAERQKTDKKSDNVSVCVRERERERVCVCVFVFERVFLCVRECICV